MKFQIILLFALAGTLFSCREEEEMVLIPEELDLSTAFTYTVDGILYEGTSMPGWGFGNPPINQMNGNPHYDTMWVHTKAKLAGNINNDLNIIIGKKFAKQDLIHAFSEFYNLSPKDKGDFLLEGDYPFVWDYFSDYSQNGVALEISAVIDGERKSLYTYTRRFSCCPSVLNPESHNESSFVITKIHRDNRGNLIVEAEFDAIFIGDESNGPTELIKKVKGTARYPVYFPE